jgi:hypothetical protein
MNRIHKHFKLPLYQSLPAILPFSTIPAPSIISSIPRNPPPITTPANPDTPLPVPFAIEWLADCKAEQAAASGHSAVYTEAAGLYHELAERWDVMRKTWVCLSLCPSHLTDASLCSRITLRYWRFRQTEMLRQASISKRMESTATATE